VGLWAKERKTEGARKWFMGLEIKLDGDTLDQQR